MSTAACRNKGYILDGYPRTIHDAKNIFLDKIPGYDLSIDTDTANNESLYPGFEVN